MSFNSALHPVGTICSQAIPALVNGITNAPTPIGNAVQPFYPQTSKILGVAGGVPANNYSLTIQPITQALATNGQANVVVASSSAVDVSVLTVYWVNTAMDGLKQC